MTTARAERFLEAVRTEKVSVPTLVELHGYSRSYGMKLARAAGLMNGRPRYYPKRKTTVPKNVETLKKKQRSVTQLMNNWRYPS